MWIYDCSYQYYNLEKYIVWVICRSWNGLNAVCYTATNMLVDPRPGHNSLCLLTLSMDTKCLRLSLSFAFHSSLPFPFLLISFNIFNSKYIMWLLLKLVTSNSSGAVLVTWGLSISTTEIHPFEERRRIIPIKKQDWSQHNPQDHVNKYRRYDSYYLHLLAVPYPIEVV